MGFLSRICASHKKGFTLIELVIVMGVVGVLAAGLLVVINPLQQINKSRDTKRKTDLEQIQRALELYYQDNGVYPDSSAAYRIQVAGKEILWGGAWNPYMGKLPQDPLVSKSYVYYSPAVSNGQTYYLYASLDQGGKDPQACNTSGTKCTNVPAGATCGNVCNYGISSANVSP